MSLRAKLLALFAALAIVPLLAVGVFDYVRSLRALESLIVAQTSLIAERAATELEDRFRMLDADAALFAGNAETATLYRTPPTDPRWVVRRDSMAAFLATTWNALGGRFVRIVYHDATGAELYRLESDDHTGFEAPGYELVRDVRGPGGISAGRVDVTARLDSLLPQAALRTRFGRTGIAAVLDDARDSVLVVAADEPANPRTAGSLRDAWRHANADRRSVAPVSYTDESGTHVGTRVRLERPPFTIMTLATRDEFSAPFGRIRTSNLAVVIALSLVVAGAFVGLLWRATRTLSELTVAADQVAGGNLEPPLPLRGTDEVGRLSHAFAYMLERVRAMLREVEHGRQMAAIGEFAALISHEIRNPLTSIKLNLQKLERAAAQGSVPADVRRPLEISLSEIQRLDRVVRGVLQLGRPAGDTRVEFRVSDIAARALDVARPQLEPRGIRVETHFDAGADRVRGNPEMLQGALVNLLLNAVEAMPGGGVIYVSTESHAGHVRARVEDDGPGIQAGEHERIFTPFFTTKSGGTGLGLALAQRTVEEHGGTIAVVEPVRGRGAAFAIDLPAMRATSV
jgi:signal transduction histidine kinase